MQLVSFGGSCIYTNGNVLLRRIARRLRAFMLLLFAIMSLPT